MANEVRITELPDCGSILDGDYLAVDAHTDNGMIITSKATASQIKEYIFNNDVNKDKQDVKFREIEITDIATVPVPEFDSNDTRVANTKWVKTIVADATSTSGMTANCAVVTDENNKIIALSALISTVIMFVVFVFIQKSSNINGSYFLPCLAFIIAGIQIMIENMNYSFKVSKIVVMTCFLVCVILSSINTCLLFLKNPPRSHENQVYIADLLMENGYEQCVGTFWNGGNVITELSNGKIESFVFSDLEYKQLNPWLQTKSHVKNYPSGKCALIIGTEECNELSYNPFSIDGVEVLHVDEELIVLGFEDIGIFFNK